MSTEEVDAVARGRVWTGAAASGLGLVDKLGGLEDAIAAAAVRARLTEYELVWPAAVESFEQRMLNRLLSTGEDLGLDLATGGFATRGLATGPLAGLVGEVQRSTAELLRWNDPRHHYLHCLCDAP